MPITKLQFGFYDINQKACLWKSDQVCLWCLKVIFWRIVKIAVRQHIILHEDLNIIIVKKSRTFSSSKTMFLPHLWLVEILFLFLNTGFESLHMFLAFSPVFVLIHTILFLKKNNLYSVCKSNVILVLVQSSKLKTREYYFSRKAFKNKNA